MSNGNNSNFQDPLLSLASGGIAGALSRTAVSPMERVKVLFQIQGAGSARSYEKGTLSTVWQIWKDEGYRGLFRGNGVNCIRIVPYTAIQYTIYEKLKKSITKGKRDLSTFEKLGCGLTGGVASVAGTYPMDLVKTRLSILTAARLKNTSGKGMLMSAPLKKNGVVDLSMWGNLKHIYYKEGGFKGLYRGFVPTSMGVAPYVAFNFCIYEQLKESAQFYIPEYSKHTILMLSIGALSGGIAQSLVYPFDILRRRFQVASMNHGSLGFQYSGVWDAIKTIIMKEGVKGLYKGWVANMWKIMPSMAVQWSTYDLIRNWLQLF
ncbi:Mrx21 protein [Martiniozyma asiatica (nom. inval.)]|nr:Mrx21 protein [Martiniozyma asiatica]